MTKTSTRALILPTISTSGINSAELSPSINSMYVASTPTWPKVGSVVSRSLIPGRLPPSRGKEVKARLLTNLDAPKNP